MSRRAGLKTLRHGWQDPDYRKSSKPKLVAVPKTPEQLAADKKFMDDYLDRMGCNTPALNRIKDMEARVAVEGDTDLNHDNIEAGQ
jgi:hypothetical protein